jgi:hypothetical protein
MLSMVDRINAAIQQASPLVVGLQKIDEQFFSVRGEPARKERYRGDDYVSPAALYFAVDGKVCIVDVHAEYVVVLSGDDAVPSQVMAVIEKIEDSLGVSPKSKWSERSRCASSRLLNLA